ncbi:MAG: type II toxin-antitoxin system RelE/ParE family toxin [Chlamydiales bacterium]
MKRDISQTRNFAKRVDDLLRSRRLLPEDFEAFKKRLVQNPEEGDLIPGTGGVRKTRLKSSTKGKSGGFRVCYFDDPYREELFLMRIYLKNEREDLTSEEKKALREFAEIVKRR